MLDGESASKCPTMVTYLEYHSAQLCSEQQLLSLRDQGVDDKMLLHICNNATLAQSCTKYVKGVCSVQSGPCTSSMYHLEVM